MPTALRKNSKKNSSKLGQLVAETGCNVGGVAGGALMTKTSVLADQITLVLAALAYLQIKHYVCDFILQRPYQYLNKGIYGHPGGLVHAGLHAIATCPLFVFITPPFKLGAAIIVAEFVVHYHIDWLKEQVMKRTGWQTADNGYWWALGGDQLLHQLFYVVIVVVLVRGVG
jgi:Protein of unknown function (DUF3307)